MSVIVDQSGNVLANKSSSKRSIEAFTFGDPTPVMDGRDILDYSESGWNGSWYEMPISATGLAKSFRSNSHHSSAIGVKKNILQSLYIPHPWLTKQDFSRWAIDFLIFGNNYIEKINNRIGSPLKLKPSLAKYTRRKRDDDQYCTVNHWNDPHDFETGSVFHLVEPDPNQEIYGVPEYLAGLNSAWLNESATLFRRKYYENGSHAGFILYMTDASQNTEDVDSIRKALKDSKGPGNFRNLFMYSPDGKKDGMQVIPIAEVQAKDEFFNIKNITRDDILAAHRVPPQIMGIVPMNTAGFGSTINASKVFVKNELEPMQERLTELNDWIGEEVIRFKPYELDVKDDQPANPKI